MARSMPVMQEVMMAISEYHYLFVLVVDIGVVVFVVVVVVVVVVVDVSMEKYKNDLYYSSYSWATWQLHFGQFLLQEPFRILQSLTFQRRHSHDHRHNRRHDHDPHHDHDSQP